MKGYEAENAVGIAQLKAHLSHHLQRVREGQSVTVMDRNHPIATIVPHREEESLRVRKPLPGAPALQDIELPDPVESEIDIVELLMEERQIDR